MERGLSSGGTADQPDDVLDAATRIRHALSQNAQDAAWLRAKGRLAILEGRPEEGIQSLTAALDWGPSSADLLTDLAVAYGIKGQQYKSATDLNHAVDLLGRALRENPNHPAALFDRALIEEELHEIVPAIADLEKLLKIEPSGPWSNETRTRLERLRQQKTGFYQRRPGQDAERFDEICLDDALRTALAGPPAALSALAYRMQMGHQDSWLTDLLAVKNRGAHADAINILGRMAAIRLTLESGRYREESAAFDALSNTPQSLPLLAWHRLEALFRGTRAREEFVCPPSSDEILMQCRSHGYHWLASQIQLQHAIYRVIGAKSIPRTGPIHNWTTRQTKEITRQPTPSQQAPRAMCLSIVVRSFQRRKVHLETRACQRITVRAADARVTALARIPCAMGISRQLSQVL
jgi:tetratricopeptide (TPR) repeat protein